MTSLARIASGIVLAAVMVVDGGGMATASGGTTLRYRCAMPLFPEQPMTVRLTWNAPKSVAVGQKTPIVPFDAVATMGEAVTQGLGVVGATTVEGTATATGAVAAPGGNTPVSVPLTVPRTPVPPAGSITVVASGRTPALVFRRPGHATVTVGTKFTVRLVPKTADGGLTMIGQVDASCTLEPGQNTILTSFEITAPHTNPAPRPGKPTATTRDSDTSVQKTPTAQETPGKAGPSSSSNPSVTTSSELPATGDTSTSGTHGTAFTTVSTAGLAEVAAPWLTAGAILVVGTVLGCVYWLRRRHRRGGRNHPGSV